MIHSPSSPKNEACYKPQQEASEVSLPGYAGEDKRQEEEDYDCYPQWHRDGDEKYEDWHSGNYDRQGSSKGKDAPRGSDACGKGWSKQNVEDIPHQPSQKKYRQEGPLSRCPEEEASQEIQAYHVEQYVGKTTVHKHTGYNRPWLLWEPRRGQAEKTEYLLRPYPGNYEDQDIQSY